MPDKPQQSRIEQLLHDLIEAQSAIQISQQDVIGEPDSAQITGSPSIIIEAGAERLVLIGSLSPTVAFLAYNKTAEAGKGITLQGNTLLPIFPMAEGHFMSAVTMGGNVDLAWQFFSQS